MDKPHAVPAPEYHERTKHSPQSVRQGPGLDFENRPTPYKRYLELDRVSLPDPGAVGTPALRATAIATPEPTMPVGDSEDRSGSEGSADRVGLETISTLCYHTTGVTTEIEFPNRTAAFRAAACTGALYHVDPYLVCGDLPGLDAGVYHYDPEHHALDVLREGDYRGVLADASDHDAIADAPVSFVLSSEWWRNAWKYRNRTFRHAFWDSGTVAANLLATAHARGHRASAVLGFADDPVVALLGLDPAAEAPLELLPVGRDDPAPAPPALEPLDPETAALSPDPKEYPLNHAAWRAGTLDDGDAANEWRQEAIASAPIGTREAGEGERVSLDPVDDETATARPLDVTVERRGSCREYDRDPVSFRKLSTVIDRAVRGAPMDVRGDDAPPLAFCDCYLAVNGVKGLESGTYHLHPAAGELERLRAGEFRREAGHLALDQRLGADAAACLYFLTDVEAITDALGDRGYRLAQFEAAVTAGRLYLATYAHRALGGTGLTFFDDVVSDFFAPRARGQTPLFLYTLGRPA